MVGTEGSWGWANEGFGLQLGAGLLQGAGQRLCRLLAGQAGA